MGIKKLEQKILEHNARESARKETIRQNAEKQKQKEKEFWDNEDSYLPKKKDIVSKVLEWRDGFLDKKAFSDFLANDSFIDLFYSNWGHVLKQDQGYGCWSRIRIEKSGKLVYFHGFKYFGGSTIPEKEFAEKLTYNYLNKLLEHIESGKVYDRIEDRLKHKY